MRLLQCAALLFVSSLPSLAIADGIAWQASYEEALKLAASEKKVVFIAVNMDGERANDRMAEKVYEDKAIVRLSGSTVNLISSNFLHGKEDRPCKRFGTITCPEHRRIDVDVRQKVLKPDEEGYVIAPQHVWLGPDGQVILSVPYEVSVPELEWCFATALQSVDPTLKVKVSSAARAPQRLILGDVINTKSAGARTGGAPPTREEALQLLDELKRGGQRGADREQRIRRLAMADEPEARDYILGVLRASAGGGRFGGGGGGRGGGGAPGEDGGEDRPDRRATLLRWIGEASPRSYWEICVDFISAGEEKLRGEAVVALEQLAAPESLKAIRSALGKEKDPTIKKNLFRALGAVGGDDSQARKALLKQSRDKRNELWRLNAILALGTLAPDEDVDALLRETLQEGEGRDPVAAAAAMALTRNIAWLEVLRERAAAPGTTPELEQALLASIGVLEGKPLGTLTDTVQKVASDEIVRRRVFGGA